MGIEVMQPPGGGRVVACCGAERISSSDFSVDPGLEVEIGCGCGSEEVDASPPCPANAGALAYETVVLEYGWLGEQDLEAVSAGSWFDTFQHFDFWHDVGVGFDRARTGSRLTVDVAGLTEWLECAGTRRLENA